MSATKTAREKGKTDFLIDMSNLKTIEDFTMEQKGEVLIQSYTVVWFMIVRFAPAPNASLLQLWIVHIYQATLDYFLQWFE